MKIICAIFIVITLSSKTVQRSYQDSPSYVGAIVEYSPILSSPDIENLSDLNANNYLKIIEKAASYDTDIILFPESSLSTSLSKNETINRSLAASYIPDPTQKIVPCDDKSKPYSYSLKSISCAAKKHQIYVVINHMEKVDCASEKGCPADGFLIYNTNVAFDRNGQVVARYRKYNLFGESGTNITETPIPTTFKTDFGVTFGTFICFDLIFETPTLNLTRDLNVTDVLFSAHWFSELPYLHAVEAQAAWAYANDANFLASGFNYPATGSGGSGIYLGKEGYAKVISQTKKSNILVVAEIPKVVNGKRTKSINRDRINVYEFKKEEINTGEETAITKYSYKRDRLSPYTAKLIDLRQKSQNVTICDRNLCCEFKLTIDFNQSITKNNPNYYRYRFSVFNGTRSYDGFATGGVKICGIIYCTNDTLDSCGHIIQDYEHFIAPTTFTSLEIKMQNVSNQNTLFMPTTFVQGLTPINVTDFDFESNDRGKFSTHRMILKKPLDNLLTFSIYGRNFALDGTAATKGVSNALAMSPIILILIFVIPQAVL